jgi:ABC-type multidrug transport system ATPase subunit
MTLAIETEHLTPVFVSITAIAYMSLLVKEGDVFGMLGPDGADKTTSVRLRTGFSSPAKAMPASTEGMLSLKGLRCGE